VKRSHVILLLLAHLVVVAAILVWAVSLSREDDGVKLGGMTLSEDDLAHLAKDTMGKEDLAKLPLRGPKDAVRDLEGELVDGVRTFHLTAKPVRWAYRDGQSVAVWAYNGQVPGPTLHATEGERVRVQVTNDLPQGTTIHWHGLDVKNSEDGVPGLTQQAIEPGESYTYEFTAAPAGTRWYHTHGPVMTEETPQLDMGLSGAFVITPAHPAAAPDVDEVLVLDEWNIGQGGFNAAMLGGHASHGGTDNVFTINGRAEPDVRTIMVHEGDRVRLRYVNVSSRSYHPMHLHGHQVRVVAVDGNPVKNPLTRNVELLAPGQTADVEFIANNPGVWMLHCHDLHHSDAGMMMLVQYVGSKRLVASDGHTGHTHVH
jgi:FtsP/CotA-like multicopper oxidase with cupredoxin domain